jgi:hypothetical protein
MGWRTPITTAERACAYQQLRLAGLTAATIAKSTGTKPAVRKTLHLAESKMLPFFVPVSSSVNGVGSIDMPHSVMVIRSFGYSVRTG